MDPKILPVVVAGAVILFGLYRRFRRQFGQQAIQPTRMTVRTLLLAVAALLALLVRGTNSGALAGGLGGLVAGAALAVLGLRLTKFEWRNGHGFYTPNTHIGIVLTALLVSRLLYRFLHLAPGVAGDPGQLNGPNSVAMYASSPLTRAIFLSVIGYYLVYFAGILLFNRQHARNGKGAAA